MPRIRDLGINVIPGGLWADQGCHGSGCQESGPQCAPSCGDSCRRSCADTPQCAPSCQQTEKAYHVGGLDVAAIAQLRQQLHSYVGSAL